MILGHMGSTDIEVKRWFYTFHMPCFFIISGYLHKNHDLSTTSKYLLLPVLIISSFNFIHRIVVMYFLLDVPFDPTLYFAYPIAGFFLFPSSQISVDLFTGFWYIALLLVFRVWLSKFNSFKSNIFALLVCFAYIAIIQIMKLQSYTQDFIIERSFYCYFFYYSGYLLRKSHFIEMAETLSRWKKAILSLLVFVLLCGLSLKSGGVDIYTGLYGNSFALYFILPLFYFINFALFFQTLPESVYRNKFILTTSKGTLLILGMHSIIISDVGRVLKHTINLTPNYMLMGLMVLAILYYPILWCEKRLPIIIGKKSKDEQNR